MPKKKKNDDDEFVIKCCLKEYTKEEKILPIIAKWIPIISKIAHRGSLIFNHYLIYCLNNNIPLNFNLTFFIQIFTVGIEVHFSSKRDPNLRNFFDSKQHLYPKVERI